MLEEVATSVEFIRGIAAEGEPNIEFVSRDEFRQIVQEEAEAAQDEENTAENAAAERFLKAVGAVAPDVDLLSELDEATAEGVLGFYSFEDQKMTLIGEFASADDVTPYDALTYAHEYTHLLQDIRYDLTALYDPEVNAEGLMALSGLVEGEATMTSLIALSDYGGPLYLLEALEGGTGGGEESPYEGLSHYLTRTFLFPYSEGVEFVSAVTEQVAPLEEFLGLSIDEETLTAWQSEIEQVYDAPPTTTEHILHPEKYFAGEEQITVPAIDVLPVLGEGWTAFDPEPLGEFFLLIWLEALEADPELIAEAAAGWGGDGSVLAGGPEGASAAASHLVWDDPATDPEQFRSLLVQTLDGLETFDRLEAQDPAISVWAGPVDYIAIAGEEVAPSDVLFATAPTPEQAEALVAELISSVTAE